MGLEMKEQCLEKFLCNNRDLVVDSDSLLSDWAEVEPTLSGSSEVPSFCVKDIWVSEGPLLVGVS